MSNIVPFSVSDDPRVAPGLDLPRGSRVQYLGVTYERGSGAPTDWSDNLGGSSTFAEAITVTVTDTGAGDKREIASFEHRVTGTALNDCGAYISFRHDNDAGELFEMGRVGFYAHDVSDGTEDARFAVSSIQAGSGPGDLDSETLFTVLENGGITKQFGTPSVEYRLQVTEFTEGITLSLGGGGELVTSSGSTCLQWDSSSQRVNFGIPAVALGGGASATLGTIGGSGPTAAAQSAWLEIEVAGATRWVALWA